MTIKKLDLKCYQQVKKIRHRSSNNCIYNMDYLICIAPAIFNTGRLNISNYAAVLIVIIGMIFLYYGFRLFKNQSSKEARKLMLVSILFLTSIQLIYVIDKFI